MHSQSPGEGNGVLDDNDLMVFLLHLGPSGGPSSRSRLLDTLKYFKLNGFPERLVGLLPPTVGEAIWCPYMVYLQKIGAYVYQALE